MSLFAINSETCSRCGLCAAECPAGCIVFAEEELPVPHEKKYAYCLDCGHCMAICPTASIQLSRFTNEAEKLDKELKITAEQSAQFLKSRRSVRSFKNERLGRDLLKGLLDLAEYAPSGHNARPVDWSVAATSEKVQVVAEAIIDWMRGEVEAQTPLAERLHLPGIVKAWDNGVDMICRNAPTLAVAHGPKQGVTPLEDGVIAITYLELAATGAGLGACWCGYGLLAARYDAKVRRALGVPKGETVYGALMLGKPVRRYQYAPPRPEADVNWL